MNRICLFVILAPAFFVAGCAKDRINGPLGSLDNTPPGQVTNVYCTNRAGGAVLRYTLPKDIDLYYVKAVLTKSSGERMEVSASAYVDSLKIEGLGDTSPREVLIYSVDKSENHSVPKSVTIEPLTPAVVAVFESLDPQFGFGGFEIQYRNESRSEIAVYVLYRDETGKMDIHDAKYTNQPGGILYIRGLPNIENEFGFFVRDRYGNNSDVLYLTGTPLPEEELDKGPMYERANQLNPNWPVAWGCFDGIVGWGNYAYNNAGGDFPHPYIVYLGGLAKLSRFKIWQRVGDDTLYQHAMPKKWKIYGRENPEDEWVFIMDCQSFKPSGLPVGQYDQYDWDYATAGEEFLFPLDAGPVRYLRFLFEESWSGYKQTVFSEMTLWGEMYEKDDQL